jgi:hypothetical protein
MDNKQLEKELAEIGAELSKLENAVLTRLNAIADNLDELNKILDENQLIRARNIAVYDKNVRDSVSNLIQNDSLDKVFLLVNEINRLYSELENKDILEE